MGTPNSLAKKINTGRVKAAVPSFFDPKPFGPGCRRHQRLHTLLDQEGGIFGLGGVSDTTVRVPSVSVDACQLTITCTYSEILCICLFV